MESDVMADKQESRLANSVRNFGFSTFGKMADILARFILRTVFIRYLTAEYLGLGGLFGNILSFLSLAELGVGTAITFSLYEPIAKNDEHKIIQLMDLYRRAYIAIGLIIFVFGTALTPFLSLFVKDLPHIPYIHVIYLLFVANSAFSYFYSYKSAFISANQKSYIVSNNTYLFNVLNAIVQAIVLIISKNYVAFLVVQLIFTFISNLRISMIADQKYPILKQHSKEQLDAETKAKIHQNIRALVLQKLGMTIVFSTDNLLLTKMFGLLIEGYYSNYTLYINAVESLLYQFFHAITASVGNLNVNSDRKHQIEVFYRVFFVNFWMYGFSAIAFGCLLAPFMHIWAGKEYLLDELCTFLIVLNFYLKGIRSTASTFDNSFGLMNYNRYVPIPECVINIGASIYFAKVIGPAGIFLGTTLSTITTSLWREPYVLMKYGLNSSFAQYAKRFMMYFVIVMFLWGLTRTIILVTGVNFVMSFIIVMIVPNLFMLLLFYRSDEFKYFIKLTQRVK